MAMVLAMVGGPVTTQKPVYQMRLDVAGATA